MNCQEIVRRLQDGDMEATSDLYYACKDTGLMVARQYVEYHEAEDLFHDAFMRAVEHIGQFDPSKDFMPWFKTIVKNTCLNFLNKKKPDTFSQLSSADEDYDPQANIANTDMDLSPEDVLDRKESMEILGGMIEKLPKEQKEVLVLAIYKEMKLKDIAEIQGCSVDTVKSRLLYAKRKLSTLVSEYEIVHDVRFCTANAEFMQFMFFHDSICESVIESIEKAFADNAVYKESETLRKRREAGQKRIDDNIKKQRRDYKPERKKKSVWKILGIILIVLLIIGFFI